MYVHDLVSLFDPAVLAFVEAIPIAHRRFKMTRRFILPPIRPATEPRLSEFYSLSLGNTAL